jgi:hypothetical protein
MAAADSWQENTDFYKEKRMKTMTLAQVFFLCVYKRIISAVKRTEEVHDHSHPRTSQLFT